MFSKYLFILIALETYRRVFTLLSTKIVIRQDQKPCDTNPIINLTEVELWYKSVQQTVSTSMFQFSTESAGYPLSKCNDGNNVMGSNPFNMCKSGNDDTEERLTITLGTDVAFDEIRVYNAYGFNNPTGCEIGNRIMGATIKVFLNDAPTATYSDSFASSGTFQTLYTFTYPDLSANPTPAPTPFVSFAPTWTLSPSRAPTVSVAPTMYVPPTSARGVRNDDDETAFPFLRRRKL